MTRRAWFLAAALGVGCSSGNTVTDAAVGDGDGNSTPADATMGDAGVCAGKLLFSGEYVDWDSAPTMFRGIFDARVSESGDPDNVFTTPPNGRVALCVPADSQSIVTFTQDDYLPVRYTVEPSAVQGAFSVRGLTPARADELFIGELGVPRDDTASQVLVAVRTYPGSIPTDGARVSIGNANAGAFTDAGEGTYGAGDMLSGGAFVLFGNVELGDGRTTVSVTAPAGVTCTGPGTIALAAGELAVTTFACGQ